MTPLILINAFEVPAGADEQFVAHWMRARDALSSKAGYVDTKLHRSVAPGARFRFINIGRWASLQAFRDATRNAGVSAKGFPFAAHPGLYEVIASSERLTAPRTSVTLINPFEVPAGQDDNFIAGWERANDHLSQRPGYLSTSLHRSVGPDPDFRFVNVAQLGQRRSVHRRDHGPRVPHRRANPLSRPPGPLHGHRGVTPVTAS